MKKIILAAFLVAGSIALHAASPIQDTTTMHKKNNMQHKKTMNDTATMHKSINRADTTMHHRNNMTNMNKKMKKDSTQ